MEVLFQIRVDKGSLRAVEKALGSRIATKYETRLVKATNKLAQEALNALKSKVPIDTGELRNTFLAIDYATAKNPIAKVGIDPGEHMGRDKRPISSFELAFAKLNDIDRERHKDSHNIPPYSSISEGSSTRAWITSAKKAFNARRRSILNG